MAATGTRVKLLDSLNGRNGPLARFYITDAAAPPAAWLLAQRLQYHTALELGDARHTTTILSSISPTPTRPPTALRCLMTRRWRHFSAAVKVSSCPATWSSCS